jgi:hypothetical protein
MDTVKESSNSHVGANSIAEGSGNFPSFNSLSTIAETALFETTTPKILSGGDTSFFGLDVLLLGILCVALYKLAFMVGNYRQQPKSLL